MGQGTSIRCKRCGYTEELLGVGGQIGMLGRPVWTVACPKVRRLVDVWAPEDPESVELYWYRVEQSDMDVACPECGSVHEVWDPDKGVCPACRVDGCEIGFSGLLWD